MSTKLHLAKFRFAKIRLQYCLRVLWVGVMATGCIISAPSTALPAGQQPTILLPGTPTLTPFQPLAPSHTAVATHPPEETPVPDNSPTPETPVAPDRLSLWVDPHLPAGLRDSLDLPPGFALADPSPEAAQQADLHLEAGGQQPISKWVYALVAPFPTLAQGVSLQDLKATWRGEQAGPFSGKPLLMEESTHELFNSLWGDSNQEAVKLLPAQELLDYAWDHRPAWAIVPFEALEPRWKVLELDGQSPLRKEFDPAAYALSVPISLVGDADLVNSLPLMAPATNRDPAKLTVLAMSGVTALVRATAFTMERQGISYPGKDIGDWLRNADLTHISNEVPFAQDCPFPNPVQQEMRFCSDPRYIKLLEDVGTDIVELTGDHFQDWGAQAMLFTLELYREREWPYYGGGANLEEGRQPLLVEHNGNRLAFIGCNGKGGSFAQAGAERPGAVACDYDWMQKQIARLRKEGFLPIATFQHYEYYTYQAQPNQERDFRGVAEAGAVIVSGSQAHQPQAIEFRHGALIHYGLGNLFFDQYDVSLACRQAFIDRHVFYAGRYLGVELLPILFIDYARPRPMDAGERDDLLEAVFSASGW